MAYNQQPNQHPNHHQEFQVQFNSQHSSKNLILQPQAATLQKKSPHAQSTQTKTTSTINTPRTLQKRVRLRDYLFIAQTSSTRNNQNKKFFRHNTPQQHLSNPQTLSSPKNSKYTISSQQLYKIVRQQIMKECSQITTNLFAKMQILKQENESTAQNQQLLMLYDIQRVIKDKLKPAMHELNSIYCKQQQNTAREVFEVAKQITQHNQNQSITPNPDYYPQTLNYQN